MKTKLVEKARFIDDAINAGWMVDHDGTDLVIVSAPDNLWDKFMEPQRVTVAVKKKHLLEDDTGLHNVETNIGVNGLREYAVTGGAAWRVVKNANHPLRASRFFTYTDTKQLSDKDLCAPHKIPRGRLNAARIRGYMRWAEADFLSVKLLAMLPIEVWGPDAWIECFDGKWA